MAKETTEASFEQQLFKAADKLRKNIDAAEYKYVVLGLVFIKYISETFNELHEKLEADEIKPSHAQSDFDILAPAQYADAPWNTAKWGSAK